MNTNEEKTIGTNLTEVGEYTPYASELAEYRKRHANVVYDVTVPKQMKAAKEARAEIRTTRTSLEKERVKLKAPALERCRLIDAEAKRITAELVAMEDPIDQQIKREEGRVEAERLARLVAEQDRVDGLRAEIQVIRDAPSKAMGKPSAGIQVAHDKVAAMVIEEEHFAEFYREAVDAHEAARSRLSDMLTAQREAEEEAKRVAAERAELERMREDNARLQREADERRALDDRIRQEAERCEREAIEAAERSKREEAARIEREKVADRERQLQAERDAAQAEAAASEQRAREQEEAAEAQRLLSLTLRDAAKAVVDYFTGRQCPKVVKDLATVLAQS